MKLILLCTILLAGALAMQAQTTQQDTLKGYTNKDNIGGASVGRTLELDNEPYKFDYRYDVKYMKGWYEWKNQLNRKYGLQLGINYTSLYLRSSEVINDENNQNTASGILDIQVGWNIVNRKKGKNKGTFFVKLSDRHPYGSTTAPMFHGIFESGYYGLTATGFHDYSMRVLELNYQQTFFENRFGFVVGKIDLPNYFNFHGIAIPAQHFLGYGSSVTSTGNWGNAGLGAVLAVRPVEKLYVMASMIDVYGDLFENGDFFDLGRNWENGDFMYMGEFGYVPSYAERYFKRISVMAWKSSAYTSAGGSEVGAGEGILDSNGKVLRNYTREDMMLNYGTGDHFNSGLNKFVWDMRINRVSSVPMRPPTAIAPIVPPGEYRARLTVDGNVETQSFKVHISSFIFSNYFGNFFGLFFCLFYFSCLFSCFFHCFHFGQCIGSCFQGINNILC